MQIIAALILVSCDCLKDSDDSSMIVLALFSKVSVVHQVIR